MKEVSNWKNKGQVVEKTIFFKDKTKGFSLSECITQQGPLSKKLNQLKNTTNGMKEFCKY